MKREKKFAKMADGTDIYYEKSGHGFPLLLLHGNDGSGDFFSEQVPVLEQYFTIYLIDSRGHGQSTNQAGTLNFRLMADDLLTVIFAGTNLTSEYLGI